MDEKLELVILQNWILMSLFFIMLMVSAFRLYCSIRGSQKAQNELKLSKLWDKGDYPSLEKAANDLLAQYPNDVNGLYFLGKVLAKKGNTEEAIEVWERAQDSDPRLHLSIGHLIDATRNKKST